MAKRIISLVLTVVMVVGLLPNLMFKANAATELKYEPYPKVEYNYTTDVETGTIRYMAQNTDSDYFDWNYWTKTTYPGYNGNPEIECGTACISMALSYVGVDRTPKVLLKNHDGYTGRMWAQQDTATSKSISISTSAISSAMNDYINGNGKYSPLQIYIVPFSAGSDRHWVLLVGKISENKYLALNPWHTAGTNGTFTIQINGSSATYYGTTNPITDVKQWYNPEASILNDHIVETYRCYGELTVTNSKGTYVKSLPCSENTDPNSANLQDGPAAKGNTFTAIGLVRNDTSAGNLWYKVQVGGKIGYVFSGDVKFTQKNDMTKSGIVPPTELEEFDTFPVTGIITSPNQTILAVHVIVTRNVDGSAVEDASASADVNASSYNLSDPKIDYNVKFDKLKVGEYTYCISAKVKSTYAKSSTETAETYDTYDLHRSTFSVVKDASCSHSYTSKVTTAATCGAKGVRTYTCSKCGSSYTESIAATGKHSYTSKVTKAASCTAEGIRTYTCTGCSNSYTESIAATGHSYGGWETISAPGCATEGVQKKVCSACGDVQTQSIPAAGHKYQSTVVDATCTDYKKTVYTCTECNDSYAEYDSGAYTDWSTTKPTGIDESLIESRTEYRYQTKEYTTSDKSSLDGWTQYAVSTQWTDYGNWSDWSDTAVNANDSTKVESRKVYKWYYYQCPNCGAHMHGWGITCPTYAGGCGKGNITSDHYVKVWLTTSPDNANLKDFHGTGKYYAEIDGQRVFKHSDPEIKTQYRYCTREQQTIYRFYKWSDWSDWSTVPITATGDVQVATRTVYRYLDVKLADHQYSSTVTAPTCTAQGYTTHTCNVCGDFYIDSYVSQLEHSYQSTVTNPTCTTNGYTHNICSVCGDSFYSNYQPAPGHAYTDVVTKPTCQTQGYTTHTCSACGDNYVDSYTDYAECNYVYQSTVAPTADRTGLINEQCSYCGGYNQIVIPALNGEDYTIEVVQTPSCTENGIQRYTWKDTSHGVYYFDVLIESTGHTYTAKTVVEPTCTTQGYTTRICDVCSAGYTADYVSALGHDYQNGICTRCGAADPDYTIDPSIVDSGVCGDDLRWTLYVNGELEISGTGNMYKYSSSAGSEAPWYKYAKDIMTVSFAGEPTSIGALAFRDCVNLSNFEIPASVTSVGGQAFRNCDSLTEVIIPDSVTSVGGYLFTLCDNLKTVEIGDGITKFTSSYPFGGCSSLTSIKIGSGVTALPRSTFYFCDGLTNVEVDAENTTYCSIDGVIYSKDQTTLVAVPTAKKGKVVVSESTKKIETEAFLTCKLITEVELPEGLTSIGRYAFENCYSITKIEFPSSLTSISDTAFRACTGLKEIYFKGSAPVFWDTNIFANVTATAYYPANDSTWTDSKQQSCGGNLTWVPVSGCINSHNLKEVTAVQPTTEKDGNIAHYICDDCDKLFADAEGVTELKPEDVVLDKLPNGASINGNYYGTVEEALAAAKPGDVVKLMADAAVDMAIVNEGVTLDLNGYTLTADYFVAFNGANVEDNSDDNTGLLKVPANRVMISKANAQLPVWNGEGYVFSKVTYRKALVAHNADMVKFAFLPQFQSVATELLKDGFEGNKVTVEVRVSWETIQGREYRNLVFNNDQVGLGISSGGAFILTFSGFSQLNLTTDVAIEAVVYSETGVSMVSEAIVVDVTGE